MPYGPAETKILIDAAVKAGFRGDALITAVATAMAESSSFDARKNDQIEDSRGPMQVNVRAHPWAANINLYDPYVAMQAAFRISSKGTDFSPWSVWHQNVGRPAEKHIATVRAQMNDYQRTTGATATAQPFNGAAPQQPQGQVDEFGFPITPATTPPVSANAGTTGAPAAAAAPTGNADRIEIPGGGYMQYVPAVGDYMVFVPKTDPISGRTTIEFAGWRSAAGTQSAAEAAKNIRVNPDTGLAYVVDNQGNIVRPAPEFNQNPNSAAASAKNIRINQTTGKAYIVDNQGNIVRPAPEFDEPSKGAPKTAIQLMTEQYNQARQALGTGSTEGAAPPALPMGGGSVSQESGGSAAGPGIAPAGTGVGAIYGVDRLGNTTPTAIRIQTPGSGSPTADINATSVYQTLGTWGEKGTGDFAKDAEKAAQFDLQRQMIAGALPPGTDPGIIQRGIDAMTGSPAIGGLRNSYFPTPQMALMNQATVSRSATDGKGLKLDPSSYDAFTTADPRDYDTLFGGMATGGTVTSQAPNPTMPMPELMQPVVPSLENDLGPMSRVFPGTSPLPAGAIGEDFEGNPLYEGPGTNWNGQRGGGRGGMGYARPPSTYLDRFSQAYGSPWGSMGPQKRVTEYQLMNDQFMNNWIQQERERLIRQGRYAEADRLRPQNSAFPDQVFPSGGQRAFNMGGTMTTQPLPNSMPMYATGTQMMTNEPIVGVGMNTGQPQFTVGEPQVPGGPPAPEVLTVTPTMGPNAGMPPPPPVSGQMSNLSPVQAPAQMSTEMSPPPTPFAQLVEQYLLQTNNKKKGGRAPQLKPAGAY